MIYSISYDLYTPGQNYTRLHDLITQLSNNNWVRPLKSNYIIQSNRTAKEIYDYLAAVLDSNDVMIITEITSNFYGLMNNEHWSRIRSWN